MPCIRRPILAVLILIGFCGESRGQRSRPDEGKAVGVKPTAKPEASEGRRWAFLVGINDYANHARLKFCRQDCLAVREALIQYGQFEPGKIVMLTDDAGNARDRPTYGQIYERLPQVLELAEPGDLVFVYLSGHGAQFNDEQGKHGYFIPLDGSGRQTSIPLSWITEQLEACKAKAKVLILDACRNDLIDAGKGTRSLERSVVGDAQGKSFVTLFSCDAGQRSSEYDRGSNGVFTHFLLEALAGPADKDRDGRIDLYEAHLYARDKTQEGSLQKGVPQSPVLKGQIADPIVLTYVTAPYASPRPSQPQRPPTGSPSSDHHKIKVYVCVRGHAAPYGKRFPGSPGSAVRAAAGGNRWFG